MATPMIPFLEPIERVREEIRELESRSPSLERSSEIDQAKKRLRSVIDEVFGSLTRWQRCQLARHPERPYTIDYIHGLTNDFVELHGDRTFADDPAIVAGFAMFDGEPVALIGHQKGRDTQEKVRRNFGMPRPEGYRKALRVMQLAAQFRRPIITLVDTPGAYPGIDAEERGQAEAIARNLREMAVLPVPVIVIVTGEGGSGGALALGVGDRVLMLENAIYSVISPEGCAAILWKDQAQAPEAAEALRLTAVDLLELGVIEEVVTEPPGGAHMDPGLMVQTIAESIRRHLKELVKTKPDLLIQRRSKRFRKLGAFLER
jgi:acetyl-CoA carboxylase carboxyl transferase subunit alpha